MNLSVTRKKLESSETSDLSERNTKKRVRPDIFLFFIYPKTAIFPARMKAQAAALPPCSGAQISLQNSSDHRPYHLLRVTWSNGQRARPSSTSSIQSLAITKGYL